MFVYFIVSLIVFLGLFCGAALAYIAPEELSDGKKYLKLFLHALLILVVILSFMYLIFWKALLLVLLLALYVVLKRIPLASPFILFVSSKDVILFFLFSTLLFLVNVPIGTFFAEEYVIRKKKIFLMFRSLLKKYWLSILFSLILFYA